MADQEKLLGNLDGPEPAVSTSRLGVMAITLNKIQAREWFQKTREKVKPWNEFFQTKQFKMPKGIAPAGQRLVKNIEKFQGNYLFVFLGLVIFCIITSPLLLIAIAASLGACYIISIKNTDQKIKVMGRDLTLAQQYAAVGVISIPVFWIAGAGSVIFWLIGASIFVIALHATMYAGEEEAPFEELEMEPV
ncbi:prenylated Rab acceptor protein 1-like [Lineus longissimus]|uniref:prenylated Rab acceptor protein 1-like n=1 Tax=Lineus longissimus TaxID=88925 RepID=UPI002B4DEE11